MAKYPNITLTNAGLSMIAESQGSGQLIFTNIKLGDGSLTAGEDIKALAAVKNPLLTANISNIDTKTAGQTTLTATISNAAVTSGFFAREMGVYAKVGTDGVEKLYAYTNAGNYADYMPDKTAQINENQIKITLIVGNAASVTAIIDGSIVYPTKEVMTESISAAVETHDEKATTHAPAFAAHNADTNSHSDIRAALKKAGGEQIGSIKGWLAKAAPAGWLALDTGALVSRATYPDLWTWVQANAPLLSESDWQAQAAAQTSVGAYSTGDGSTTFRLPRLLDYMRGGATAEVGTWQGDAIRNITGSIDRVQATVATGALALTTTQQNRGTSGTYYTEKTMVFDASAVVPTADENRPKTIKVLYCVKAFDAEVNPGLVDLTALANEMAGKVDKTIYAADFVKNLGASGYQKLSGGFILQWGTSINISRGNKVTIALPMAFPVAAIGAYATLNGNIDTDVATAGRYCGAVTSGLSQIVLSYNDNVSGFTTLKWFALGC